MASIPGTQFNLLGASGTQAALVAKSGWFVYVLPRGAWAAQDSSGTKITFDASASASRFAVNDWIQAGTAVANIRKVSGVGGNSITVSGAAVTVTENDRVFLVGQTQPSTSGGSTTYTIPSSVIRTRDDDTADIVTNSMVTSNTDGLIRIYGQAGLYDCLIQDGNRSPQGYMADLPIGIAEGVSTSLWAVFGATATFNAAVGVTGTFVGNTVTVNRALGVTGWATFGSTVTMNAALGVSGWAVFGTSATIAGALGVTGTATFGATATVSGTLIGTSTTVSRRFITAGQATAHTGAEWALSAGWGQTASITSILGNDLRGYIKITAGSTSFSANPIATLTFKDGTYASIAPKYVVCRGSAGNQLTVPALSAAPNLTAWNFLFAGTPVSGEFYEFLWVALG